MIASCAVDVKFHDWDTGDCLGIVQAPDAKARGFLDISWCNQGKHLVAVPLSGKSLVVSTYQSSSSTSNCKDERWKPAKEIVDIAGVKCASFSKVENHNIVVGTVSGEVLLYNIKNKKILQTFADLPTAVNHIQYGAQNLFVAAGCSNGQIFLYGTGHSVSAAYFVPGCDSLTSISVHSKIPYLLSGGSEKGVVAIWDINSGSNILKSSNHSGSVLDMSFSTTDDSFTTIGSDQKINIYDLRTSECVHEKRFDSDLTALAYCPNGNDIAVATGRGQIICLDKRYLHSCKSGLKAHKCAIKKISFETSNNYASYANANYSKSSVEIDFIEEERLSSNDVIKEASGDTNSCKNKQRPCNLYQNLDKFSIATSGCHMSNINNADRTTFHIIDGNSLNHLREEIMKATKDIVSDLLETMNNEFLKMRMGVSREFCTMEIRNKKRWQEFNMILLKIADLDEHDSIDLSLNIKENMLSQVRSKISSREFLNRNSSKSVK